MKLGLICAMEEELAAILAEISLVQLSTRTVAGNHYFEYSYAEHVIVAVVSGIGKWNW